MSFVAKYNGSCSECGERIEVGDHATYMDNVVVHLRCASPESQGVWLDDAWAHRAKRPAKVCARCHLEVVVLNDGVCLDCS